MARTPHDSHNSRDNASSLCRRYVAVCAGRPNRPRPFQHARATKHRTSLFQQAQGHASVQILGRRRLVADVNESVSNIQLAAKTFASLPLGLTRSLTRGQRPLTELLAAICGRSFASLPLGLRRSLRRGQRPLTEFLAAKTCRGYCRVL